jgi:hypothetical protein
MEKSEFKSIINDVKDWERVLEQMENHDIDVPPVMKEAIAVSFSNAVEAINNCASDGVDNFEMAMAIIEVAVE